MGFLEGYKGSKALRLKGGSRVRSDIKGIAALLLAFTLVLLLLQAAKPLDFSYLAGHAGKRTVVYIVEGEGNESLTRPYLVVEVARQVSYLDRWSSSSFVKDVQVNVTTDGLQVESGYTDDKGRVIFELAPANYTVSTEFFGLRSSVSVLLNSTQSVKVSWTFHQATVKPTLLQLYDDDGSGIIESGEVVKAIYTVRDTYRPERVELLHRGYGGELPSLTKFEIINSSVSENRMHLTLTPAYTLLYKEPMTSMRGLTIFSLREPDLLHFLVYWSSVEVSVRISQHSP